MSRVVVDQSDWGKLRVTGADRVRFLQGMLTNDVGLLAEGGWVRASMLTVKGRVVFVTDVVHQGASFLMITEPATTAKLAETLRKYAIMDDVEFTPEEHPLHRVWDGPADVWTAPPIFAPPPAPPSSPDEVEVRRVEGGLPRYGVDVSEDYFPFEANLDAAISYTKGCYIGQEVVARAHARGQANKRLVGLRLAAPLAAGAVVGTPERPDAGRVTSAVVSPDFGPIALAYVHKSAWDPGTKVRAGDVDAVVSALPFQR